MSRNRWIVHLFILLVCGAGIAGCVSPTPYEKTLTQKNSFGSPLIFGYNDKHVDGNLYRVNFIANGKTDARVVYAYALLRSADLTHELGFTWFEIVEGAVDRTVVTDDRKLSSLEGSPYERRDSGFDLALSPTPIGDEDVTPKTSAQRMLHKTAFVPIYVPSGNYTFPSTSLLIRVDSEKPADASRAFDAVATRDALRAKMTIPVE